MQLNPNLVFNGNAEDVFAHYRDALGKTFWPPRFGMLTDRFGIKWTLNLVEAA